MFKNCLYGRGKPQKSPPPSIRTEKPPPPLGKKSSKEEPTWGKRSYSLPMGARRGGGSRRSPPPPTGNFFFWLFGGPFCYFFTMWGPVLTLWGAFFRLAPYENFCGRPWPLLIGHLVKKCVTWFFQERGRAPILLPPLSGHPSPPYKNRSASFFASYDLNLM